MGARLLAARAQRRQREFWRDFLPFRPVVVGVALGAARVGVTGAGSVTGFASRNTGQQDVAGFCTRQSLSMTVNARESTVSVVIELRVRHPLSHRASED